MSNDNIKSQSFRTATQSGKSDDFVLPIAMPPPHTATGPAEKNQRVTHPAGQPVKDVLQVSCMRVSETALLPASTLPIHHPGEEQEFNLTDGTTIRMCWILPGTCLMGSPNDESGRCSDETQHPVTISKGFWMAKFPKTQGQWYAVMGTRPSTLGKPGPPAA